MAYLRGGSVVDGDLYVEGRLVIENTTDANGIALPKFGSIDDVNGKDYLVRFKDDNGQITHVKNINETLINKSTVYAKYETGETEEFKIDKVTYNTAPLSFSYSRSNT